MKIKYLWTKFKDFFIKLFKKEKIKEVVEQKTEEVKEVEENKIILTFNKKEQNIRDIKKIINFLNARQDESDEETLKELVIYSLDIIWKDNIDYSKLTLEQKKLLELKTMNEVTNMIRKYNELEVVKESQDRICVTIDDKDIFSNYINVEVYYYILDNLLIESNINKTLREFSEEMANNVIYTIYDGIVEASKLYDIKVNDVIYWEIIIDDLTDLIMRTIDEGFKIKPCRNPLTELDESKQEVKNEYQNNSEIIYSICLDNFNQLKSDVDRNPAVKILKQINELNRKRIRQDVDSYLERIKSSYKNNMEDFLYIKESFYNILNDNDKGDD